MRPRTACAVNGLSSCEEAFTGSRLRPSIRFHDRGSDVIMTARQMLLLGGILPVVMAGMALADEPLKTTTAEIIRNPADYDGKPVAVGGCQLGQLPDGPACWVLVKGRNVGVLPLRDLPQGAAQEIQDACPRAGIGNGQACLVRVFGWVETGSQVGTTLKGAAIKWPD